MPLRSRRRRKDEEGSRDIITGIKDKFLNLPRDFRLFLAATFVFGFSQSIVDSTLNNFLHETFSISDLQRGLMEFPREVPGLLVVFVSALLFSSAREDRQPWPMRFAPSESYSWVSFRLPLTSC